MKRILLFICIFTLLISSVSAFSVNNLSFKTIEKNGIQIEIGDKTTGILPENFKPILNLSFKNSFLSLNPVINETGNIFLSYSQTQEKVNYTKGNMIINIYNISNNGEEYEIILLKKPITNKITFDINNKNFNWYYQPALNITNLSCLNESFCGGDYRDTKIVNSYAIYNLTHKIFHLYRIIITDSLGIKTYGIMNYNKNQLVITIDQKYLDNAKYPIIIDPTFGYTSTGGTYDSSPTGLVGTKFSLTEDGIPLSMSVYSFPDPGYLYSYGIYNSSLKLQINTTYHLSVNSGITWYLLNFSSSICLPSGDYWLFQNSATSYIWLYYDSGLTNQSFENNTFAYNWLPSLPSGTYEDRKYSMFVEYSPSSCSLSSPILPTANFTENSTTGITPFPVSFTDTSLNATSWYWDFGDGNTSYLQNPTHIYNVAGLFTVRHNATNSNGTSWYNITNDKTVSYPLLPVCNFTENSTTGITPFPVSFTDTSLNATSWYWNFGDGNTSSSQNPVFTYNVEGIFTVSHSCTNSNGTTWYNITNDKTVTYPTPPTTTPTTTTPTTTTPTTTTTTPTTINATPLGEFNLTVYDKGETFIIWHYDTIYNITNLSLDSDYQSYLPTDGYVVLNNLKPYSPHLIQISNGTYISSLTTYTDADIYQYIYARIWFFIAFIMLIASLFISRYLAYFAAIIYFINFIYFISASDWITPFFAIFMGMTSILIADYEVKT